MCFPALNFQVENRDISVIDDKTLSKGMFFQEWARFSLVFGPFFAEIFFQGQNLAECKSSKYFKTFYSKHLPLSMSKFDLGRRYSISKKRPKNGPKNA